MSTTKAITHPRRVYRAEDSDARRLVITIDGAVLKMCIAACPSEGWAEAFAVDVDGLPLVRNREFVVEHWAGNIEVHRKDGGD